MKMKFSLFLFLILFTNLVFSFEDGAIVGEICSRGSSKQCSDGLVCKAKVRNYCSSDYECQKDGFVNFDVCKTIDDKNYCKHKDLLPHINWSDIVVSFLLFMGGAVAAGGGVGGGGIFVPLLILVGGFKAKEAIPLSNSLICGASIANYIQMGPRRHPTADRPLIDYNLALLLQPLSLGGTVIGVIFHSLFPTWLILLLLIIVLTFTTQRTGKKAAALWKIEGRTLIKSSEGREDGLELNTAGSEMESNPELEEILLSESRTPWHVVLVMFSVLIVMSSASILKGGSSAPSIVGIESCSTGYWVIVWAVFPFLGMVTFLWGKTLLKRNKVKEANNYPYQDGDIRYNRKNVVLIAFVSILAGILASLLGIGGGMVLSPLMLELRLLPDVTASTSSFMILFTSISAIVQFIVLGQLDIEYGVWFFMIGLGSSWAGQTVLNYLIKKYHKKSYIVLAIALVIGLSNILLLTTGLMDVIDRIKAGAYMGFHSLC